MMAEQIVTGLLLADADVVAAIGPGDAARIYVAGKAPQNGPYPYVTYQRIAGRPVVGLTLDGESGLDAIRVQVNSWDKRIGGNAMALAQKVRRALHGKTGSGPGQQSVECGAPADFDSDEKLDVEGARLDAVVTMNEAAEAA